MLLRAVWSYSGVEEGGTLGITKEERYDRHFAGLQEKLRGRS